MLNRDKDRTALVSKIELDSGRKVSRRYERSPGGIKLRVTTTLPDGRSLFVYERLLEIGVNSWATRVSFTGEKCMEDCS